MDKVSDERLDTMIMSYGALSRHNQEAHNYIFLALTELRDRRAKDNPPHRCPICGGGHNIGNPCPGREKR